MLSKTNAVRGNSTSSGAENVGRRGGGRGRRERRGKREEREREERERERENECI